MADAEKSPVADAEKSPVADAGKYLIVNGDDLGASVGVNRGIFETFTDGILTSASLMVDMPGAEDAATRLPDVPELSVGLHATLTTEGRHVVVPPDRCAPELERQLARFVELTGRRPTHLDSHHNIHLDPHFTEAFVSVARREGLPLRAHSPARYFSSFYGQWDGETHLEQVSVDGLKAILAGEVGPGVTEIGCHPGYVGYGFESSYLAEREAEVRTLCDAGVRECVERLGIRLISFSQLAPAAGHGT